MKYMENLIQLNLIIQNLILRKMAVNNRDEQNSSFTTNIVAEVDIADLEAYEVDDMNESVVFRKDVITATVTPASTTPTVNFNNDGTNAKTHDTYDLDITGYNVTITVSGLVNGDHKTLCVTKAAGDTIAFTGVTDISARRNYIDNSATYVVYDIYQKNSITYANSINIENYSVVETAIVEIGDWDMDSSPAKVVAHGISDFKKILSVNGTIRDDADTGYYPLMRWDPTGLIEAGEIFRDSTNIFISRTTGGFFDSADFDSTSYNRGFLIIQYTL